MIDLLKNLFGSAPAVDFTALVKQGARIVDVRSPDEYRGGHIKGSVNIPVQVLPSRIGEIPKGKPVITCCASGARSASAKRILEAAGFTEVHNGGGWRGLQGRLNP